MRKAPRRPVRGFFGGYNRLMFKRTPFWLGLLLGSLASFGAGRFRLPPRPKELYKNGADHPPPPNSGGVGAGKPLSRSFRFPQNWGLGGFFRAFYTASIPPDPLLDLVRDAVVACDTSGAVTYTNAAAQALFGSQGEGLSRLCYPSGQPVPPGQWPLTRARRTGASAGGAGYVCVSPKGKAHVLDIQARPLPGGGAVAIVRDVTALEEGRAREAKMQKREQVLRDLCRRLSAAPDAGTLAEAVVESALALVGELPEARARLYAYDSDAKRLTRLASAPDDRPKRPKSQRQAQPPAFPFDAASQTLWSLYVERQPVMGDDVGSDEAGPAYAVPLLAGGIALGHLSVICPDADALTDGDLRESLALLASVAALALAGPRQAAQATQLAAQVDALREVIQAVGERNDREALADLVGSRVCRVTGAEVCTLALKDADGLRLIGTAYRDALTSPDRHAPDDPALTEDGAKAARTGKTTQRVGRANPPFSAGVWRAFAGQSGRHSVLAVPLAAGQGALTVYRAGDAPFPGASVKFVETLAALVSSALPQANRTEAHAA